MKEINPLPAFLSDGSLLDLGRFAWITHCSLCEAQSCILSSSQFWSVLILYLQVFLQLYLTFDRNVGGSLPPYLLPLQMCLLEAAMCGGREGFRRGRAVRTCVPFQLTHHQPAVGTLCCLPTSSHSPGLSVHGSYVVCGNNLAIFLLLEGAT